MTDTDSLMYQVFTEDLYSDMMDDRHMFDTSEYPPDHPLFSLTNQKKIGVMKDETKGRYDVLFVTNR